MSKKSLRTELEHVLDEGLAVNDEELSQGLISMACSDLSGGGREVVAALNMAAHTSMVSIEDMADRLSPHLVSTADQISARLGTGAMTRGSDESSSFSLRQISSQWHTLARIALLLSPVCLTTD